MKTGRLFVGVLLFLIFACFSVHPGGAAEKCKTFELGSNPVDVACPEIVHSLVKPGQCIGTLTRAVGPLNLCGGNGKCGNGCLGVGEKVAFDPNGAGGCAELLFALSCCNPPEATFCLPAGSYEISWCKPMPAIPPSEFNEPEPQKHEIVSPGGDEVPTPAPEPEPTPTTTAPPPAKKCGPWCKTVSILAATAGALYGLCEWQDWGPCDDGDDRNNNECEFGRGVDGRCIHPCNPGDPNCEQRTVLDTLDTTMIGANRFDVRVELPKKGEIRLMWYVPIGKDWRNNPTP